MESLKNKIDFAVVICVNDANPNGDPLNGNRPRTTFDGYGEISDVCIKRKIRNRWMAMQHSIFVQSDDRREDAYVSLRARAEGVLKQIDIKNAGKFCEAACEQWIDVRAFGQVFAYSGKKGSDSVDEDGVSIHVRGPVSVSPAYSIAPVSDRISSIQITKSVNGQGDGKKRGPDTMGMKHRVDHGVYVCYGAINPQLATKTGFSDQDAEAVKEALKTLFRDDASAARPEGSMEVYSVYWWTHQSKSGQYSSAKVHRSVRDRLRVKDGITEPRDIMDYEIPGLAEIIYDLPGLACEILDGE